MTTDHVKQYKRQWQKAKRLKQKEQHKQALDIIQEIIDRNTNKEHPVVKDLLQVIELLR